LSEGQIRYAASDAYYLLDIFDLFQQKVSTEGIFSHPQHHGFDRGFVGSVILSFLFHVGE
jgi:ribonuclease D